MKKRCDSVAKAAWGPMLLVAILLGCVLHVAETSYGAEKTEALQTDAVSSPPQSSTIPDATPVQPEVGIEQDHYLDKSPVRKTKGLDLVKEQWTYDCMSCHRLLEAKWHYDRKLVEHESIVLNHGNNRFCLNCHHAKNRNAFVDYDGAEIAEEDVVSLCAKCHGPTYQDWKAGAHGRTNGFWDKSKGPQTKLRCIQCHDPHTPKFPKMDAFAAPTYPKRAAGAHDKHESTGEDH